MKKLFTIALIALAALDAFAQSESYVQLPPNSTGVKLRMRCNTISANLVCSQGFFIDDGSGSGPLGLLATPLFVTFTNSAIAATQSGSWDIRNITGTVSLPTNAAQETGGHLAAIDTNTAGVAKDATVSSPQAAIGATLPSKVNVVGGSDYGGGTPHVQGMKVDSSGNVYVILNNGSSAVIGHVVLDSGSTTAVTQATASNLNATVAQGAAASLASGWPTTQGQAPSATATWTSATVQDTSLQLTTTGYASVSVATITTGTVTAAAINFEQTIDGSTWRSIEGVRTDVTGGIGAVNSTASVSSLYVFNVASTVGFRIRLNPAIVGSGSITLTAIASAASSVPIVAVSGIATAPNFNVLNVGGVAVATNNGLTTNGTQRVTISSDSSGQVAIANNAPSNPVYVKQSLAPPSLTLQQQQNPLLYRSAMQAYCMSNLCPPWPSVVK